MSVFWGAINLNGNNLNSIEFREMKNSANDFPHDRTNIKNHKNVVFAKNLRFDTPEDIHDSLPFYDANKALFFMADGRIDNRQELCQKLNIELTAQYSDAEIMCQAFQKYNREVGDYLIGDWILITYDFRNQELYIIRDHHGYTSFFYYIDNNEFVFCSSLKPLLCNPKISKEINTDIFIRGLTIKMGGFDQTMFKEILNLPPAHFLTLKKKELKTQQYWFPNEIKAYVRTNENEYIEVLDSILAESVASKLRSYKPIACMLSGGLDSGTVAYVAASQLALVGKELNTFSHIPLHQPDYRKNRMGDESGFIQKTAASLDNINTCLLNSSEITPIEGLKNLVEETDFIIHAASNAFWLHEITKVSAKRGFGVLLNGEQGNATISYTGSIVNLSPTLIFKTKGIKGFIKEFLAKPIYYKLLSFSGKSHYIKRIQRYSYLKPSIFEKGGQFQLLDNFQFEGHQPASKMLMPGMNFRNTLGSLLSQFHGISWRDPLADKRVIEFCFSIPNEVFFNSKGEPKNVIKKLMHGRLPESVLYQSSKGLQSADINKRLLTTKLEVEEVLNQIVQNKIIKEFIDLDLLQNDWKLICENKLNITQINSFLKVIMAGILFCKYE